MQDANSKDILTWCNVTPSDFDTHNEVEYSPSHERQNRVDVAFICSHIIVLLLCKISFEIVQGKNITYVIFDSQQIAGHSTLIHFQLRPRDNGSH